MIFNKTGKTIKSNFLLGSETITTTANYDYLGLTFTPSGKLQTAIANLSKKASKALFKLKHCTRNLNLSPKTSMKLYDHLIRPICTYSCEFWGPFLNSLEPTYDEAKDNYNLFDKHPFERLEIKFMKSILGVHEKASNAAVRGELGRFPTSIYIMKQTLKNWYRITSCERGTLLYDSYLCNAHLYSTNNNSKNWWSNIKKFFENTLNLPFLVENLGQSRKTKTKLARAKSEMEVIFQYKWYSTLDKEDGRNQSGGNKLRTYRQFKHNFTYEQYLDNEPKLDLRKNITKFRISAHKLEIETGRYLPRNDPRREPKNRICKHCNLNETEDELHVLVRCPNYHAHREILMQNLTDTFPNIIHLNTTNLFNFIVSCGDYEITIAFSKFLQAVKTSRGNL
jgi:hypothetical protein